MQPLLFFSRVTFICNICFILTVLMYFIPSPGDGHVVSTILVLGVVVAVVLNMIVNLFIIVILLRRRPLWQYIPKWLVIFNLVCLIPQIIFFPA
jgi:threonine/homoserine/homoserine lactone efflux protein